MRRSTVLLCLAASAISLLAACGGSDSDGDTPETPEPSATTTGSKTPTPLATAASNLTPVSVGGTATAPTPTVAATTAAEAPTATPAQAQAQPTSVVTQAPPPPPPPPTATTPAQSGNPLSATVGVTGGTRFFWAPNTVVVAPGGTVTWAWNEPAQPHNVVGDNFPVSSQITKSDSVSYTFASAGTYTFHCETHPDTMRGKVVVQ